MKIVKGNLLDMFDQGDFDVIIHGCNCFCVMRAGIAGQISARYPGAAIIDHGTRKGDVGKLSDWSTYAIPGEGKKFVINLYTQFRPGPEFQVSALDLGLFKLRESWVDASLLRIGVPWIGCGIGGGDQLVVRNVFERHAREGLNLTVVEFQP